MLKLYTWIQTYIRHYSAAFGRLRVETQPGLLRLIIRRFQPPSGGCVLKLTMYLNPVWPVGSAAFGRLRVETCLKMVK